MADEIRDALTAAIQRRADEDTTSLDAARRARSARTPDINNPLLPIYERPRRGGPTYRDPVGEQAIGNIKKEKK